MNKYGLLITAIIMLIFSSLLLHTTAYAEEIKSNTYTTNVEKLNVRQKASASSKKLDTLKNGTNVKYRSTTTNNQGEKWYKIRYKVDGINKDGYVFADYITVTSKYDHISRQGAIKSETAAIYKNRTTDSSKVVSVPKDTPITTLNKFRVGEKLWYEVSLKWNNQTVKGYIRSSKISLYPTTVKSTVYRNRIVKTKTGLYQKANKNTNKLATINSGVEVVSLGNLKVGTAKWTKVAHIKNNKTLTGYVPSSTIEVSTQKITSKEKYEASAKRKINIRRIPNIASKKKTTIKQGEKIQITNTIKVNKNTWYECTYTSAKGKKHTGYVLKSEVTLTVDSIFKADLAKFPNSYKESLKALHKQYPHWRFIAVDTGLDWKTVIDNQDKLGKNTISSTVPNGGSAGTFSAPFSYLSTDNGAYNWSTDTYRLCDGTTWYTADRKVIEHYMDPRNFLQKDTIFQFETLEYNSSQSSSVVRSILKNTFMEGNYKYIDPSTKKTVTASYVTTFMTAGKNARVSPYFLASRAKQELGINGSASVTGNHPEFNGYYNFFNIGANDSAGGGAIDNGLLYAKGGAKNEKTYGRPWDTPYKAILGGAQYIGSAYISKGQNTKYFQKFNVVNKSNLYWHQYMTNVQAPRSEGIIAYNAYRDVNVLSKPIVFYIPVYKNMPTKNCDLPAAKGNPNSYINTITCKNQKGSSVTKYFNKAFKYSDHEYTMTVPNSVSEITFDAKPVSSHAMITSGINNTYSLAAGKTITVSITCRAGDGTTSIYNIRVTRER